MSPTRADGEIDDRPRRARRTATSSFIGRRRALAGVVYGGAPLDTIEVEGDMELARRFVDALPAAATRPR